MIFTYRDNPAWTEEAQQPKLWATIDLTPLGVATTVDALPIYVLPLKTAGTLCYKTWVAGLPLERRSLEKLETTVAHYLGALIHYASLPEYIFQLGKRAWPIYRYDGELLARLPGSRHFAAATIGELRNDLADHFKEFGVIDYRKQMTVLHLSRHDLQAYAPIGTLRAPGMAEIPVFHDVDEVVQLFAPLNGRTIRAEMADGAGLLDLPALVGNYLVARGGLRDADDVGVRKLSPSAWAAVARHLHRYSARFTYTDRSGDAPRRREIPIYVDEPRGKLIAARTNRMGRVSLHFAADIPHLQYKVGEELTEIGKIRVPTYVTVNGIEETAHAQYVEARGGSTLVALAV
jgi:hypothetical protein